MGIAPRLLGEFFAPFFLQGQALPPDVRLLLLGDSTFTTNTATTQGSFGAAILDAWGIPMRADGRNPVVGLSGRGPERGNERWAGCTTVAQTNFAGWGTPVERLPGAAASNSATDVSPHPYTDLGMASGARTSYGGDGTGVGVPLTFGIGRSSVNGALTGTTDCGFGAFGTDPFSGVQCHATWISTGAGATRGTNDMRIQGMRWACGSSLSSAGSTGALNLNRGLHVGSKTTMDLTPSGGVLAFKVDCGAGPGLPGFIVINPNAADSSAARTLFSTGFRVCRTDSGGIPIDGVHIAGISTATYTITDIRKAVGDDASPTFSAANFLNYVRAYIGKGTDGVNNGPTHIVLQCGYNYSSGESAANQAGNTATYRDNIIGLIQYLKAASVILSNNNLKILVLFCGAMWQSSRTRTEVETAELAASQAAAAEGCAFYSMFNVTDTGVANFNTVQPWYTRGASVASTASGDGSGPVATGDFLHPSLRGAEVLMRKLWDDAADELGYQAWPDLITGLPLAAARGGGARGRGR